MQFHAYRALYLLYHDWGEYATDYLKHIREPHRSLIHYFVTGGHWNPLMTNVMTLALRIFPAVPSGTRERRFFSASSRARHSSAPLCSAHSM